MNNDALYCHIIIVIIRDCHIISYYCYIISYWNTIILSLVIQPLRHYVLSCIFHKHVLRLLGFLISPPLLPTVHISKCVLLKQHTSQCAVCNILLKVIIRLHNLEFNIPTLCIYIYMLYIYMSYIHIYVIYIYIHIYMSYIHIYIYVIYAYIYICHIYRYM